MSTSFNFPANPALNDTFTLPNGSVSQWNGTEWVGVNTASVTYPLAVGLGGTAGDTAGKARINLGLNLATGEFIVQKDGTAAQPGIAFASEPGLGFYRIGASDMGLAVQGSRAFDFYLNSPTDTILVMNPRVAGKSYIALRNQNGSSANYNELALQQAADGSASINTFVQGTATRGNLTLDAPVVFASGGQVFLTAPSVAKIALSTTDAAAAMNIVSIRNGFNRWAMYLGDGAAESGTNAGSNFVIDRYTDAGAYLGRPFQINRATGNVTAQGLTRQEDHDELRATVVAALARIAALRATVAGALVRIAALEAG